MKNGSRAKREPPPDGGAYSVRRRANGGRVKKGSKEALGRKQPRLTLAEGKVRRVRESDRPKLKQRRLRSRSTRNPCSC